MKVISNTFPWNNQNFIALLTSCTRALHHWILHLLTFFPTLQLSLRLFPALFSKHSYSYLPSLPLGLFSASLSLSLSHTYLFSSKEVKNSQILLSFLHKWPEKTPIFNHWSLILFCILFPPFISIIKKIIKFPIKPEGITFCNTFTFTLIVFIILSISSEVYSAMLIPTLFGVRKIGIRILLFLFTSRVNLDTFRSSVNVNFYKS